MALSDGLVGYWSPWLGSSGYLLIDRVRSNNGTLTNMDAGTDWVGATVQGRSGFALDFDGSNDQVNTTAFLPTASSRSAVLWVNLRGGTGGVEYWAFGQNTLNAGQAFYLGSIGTTLYVTQFGDSSNGGTLTLGRWHMIAATHVGSSWSLYLDGRLTATKTMTTTPTAHAIFIGAAPAAGRWNGQIADACVFNRALTAPEMLHLYRLGPGWYQPYRKRGYGYAAAVAGFKPYWHRRETQLIGGGLR